MKKTKHNTTNDNQQGFVAFFVTIMLMIIFGILILSFSQISNREGVSALNRDLSTNALYAAESGINDAYTSIRSALSSQSPSGGSGGSGPTTTQGTPTTFSYNGTLVSGAGTPTTLTYTGNNQTYTVPAGVTSINVTLYGAQGGGGNGAGGNGGETTGTLSVTPGQVLTVVVAGVGTQTYALNTTSSGGFGGGGSTLSSPGSGGGGSGGGASQINASSTELAIAGGGGGVGGNGGGSGGNGGGLLGANGVPNTFYTEVAGTGGTQSGGGSGANSGSLGHGGNGASGTGSGFSGNGGGGGGGYYGGGGGSGWVANPNGGPGGPGGGGSSLVPSGGSTIIGGASSVNATQSGNGEVIITPVSSQPPQNVGTVQSYTVPAGATSLDVNVFGAAGGAGAGSYQVGGVGGLGAEVTSTIPVTAGQVLYVAVGGQGGNGAGCGAAGAGGWGLNDGGAGGSDPYDCAPGGGGGGESVITSASNTILVEAGGGGGGGGGDGYVGGNGGEGGALGGGSGGSIYDSTGGGGGNFGGPGTGGSSYTCSNGAAGSLVGGAGGGTTNISCAGPGGGGGGSGDYSGSGSGNSGGGGGVGSSASSGGGGAPSYAYYNTQVNSGVQAGNGQVIITPIITTTPAPAPSPTAPLQQTSSCTPSTYGNPILDSSTQYTCVLVSSSPSTLSYLCPSFCPNNSLLTLIQSSGNPINNLTIKWSDSNIANSNGCSTRDPLPFFSYSNWPANCQEVLRVDLVPFISGTTTLSSLESGVKTFFLYPQSSATGTQNFAQIDTSNDGTVYPANCSTQPTCSFTVQGLASYGTTFYARIQYYYGTSPTIGLTGTDTNGNPISFTGSQIQIDATGLSGTILKRVSASIALNGSDGSPYSLPLPPNDALQSTDSICKSFLTYQSNLYEIIPTSKPGDLTSAISPANEITTNNNSDFCDPI